MEFKALLAYANAIGTDMPEWIREDAVQEAIAEGLRLSRGGIHDELVYVSMYRSAMRLMASLSEPVPRDEDEETLRSRQRPDSADEVMRRWGLTEAEQRFMRLRTGGNRLLGVRTVSRKMGLTEKEGLKMFRAIKRKAGRVR